MSDQTIDLSDAPASEAGEKEIASIDVDAELSKADPSFDESLKDFQSDLANIQIQTDEELEMTQEQGISVGFFKKTLYLARAKGRQAYLFSKYLIIWIFTDGLMKIVNGVVGFFRDTKQSIKSSKENFSLLSGKQKFMFLFSLLILGGSVAGFYFLKKTHFFEKQTDPFIGSFSEVAQNTFKYDVKTQVEPLFGSTRIKVYAFQLKPMVVNLVRKNPNANPMGVFEFICEGNSKDVLVEIKMRESEVRDLVQRQIEGFDYDTLDTKEGKILLREQIKSELNSILHRGELLRVQIKSIIIKP